MDKEADYVVAYDITSNGERRRTEKTLKGFGFRMQKSVFECKLKKRDRELLIQKLVKLSVKTGFVKIYQLGFQTKHVTVGIETAQAVDNDAAFIV